MVLQSENCTAVVEIDEKFVLGSEEENYDIIFNPENIKRNEPHDAIKIIAKTKETLKIAVVIRHNKDTEYSALLNGKELYLTFEKNALTVNLETGELLHYEKDAFSEEFDFSLLDKMLE